MTRFVGCPVSKMVLSDSGNLILATFHNRQGSLEMFLANEMYNAIRHGSIVNIEY